ncbi:glutamate--cysteine ligase [Agromyces seonyuensis]|uniref:Putative glutamate--cysteine ligase 2 n=1 Tax=Agromyces seonyuensis TaxID=2662446 RepID=A0A6I4NVD7_9MICO|nr:glutamate--cysteine ligase [Agromyces seonyuensis]MWB98280.1 glutamate--cysteine ligase [Agromyces seonyuensis]
MHLEFAPSQRSTLGVEWEIALVDRNTGDLVSAAPEILAELATPPKDEDGRPLPHMTAEFQQNTVELVTGVHERVGTAVDELRGLLGRTRAAARGVGDLDLMCAGTHPFAEGRDQRTTEHPRYARFIERTRWWGENMLIWGVHVHVGIEDRDKALPIADGLLRYLPHLLAVSASSPFWNGEATGYASNRTLLFQQLPTAGLPYPLADWASFERYIDDLVRTDVIADSTEFRGDIRVAPQWGTVELRMCDGVSSTRDIAALAALSQCLVELLSTRLDEGVRPSVLQPWYVRENKWRAARYGLAADVIVDVAGTQVPLVDDLRDLLGELEPIAVRLGCARELAHVRDLIDDGGSAARQLAVAEAAGGDLREVVAHLVRELAE